MPESTLKPFRVYTDEAEDGAELVWAADAAAAVTVAKSGPLFSDLDEETELYAGIEDVIPGTLPAAGTSPHVEARDRVLRQYGWSYEGDRRCDDCDLATMDGAFPLCVDCDRCTECGHADDCRRGLLLGNQAERFGEIAGRLIYVAGPYRGVDAAQVQRHLARVGLLNRLLVRLYAHPITLHAAIHAGHYGRDDVSREREAGLEVASAIARRIRDAGGGVLALEQEGGGLSSGTRCEVEAANNGTAWGLIGRGREPQPGIAVLRWRDLGPAFQAEGLGREWEALVAVSTLATGGELFPHVDPGMLYEAPPCHGIGPVAEADDLPGWPPTPPPRVVPDRTPAEIIGENITQAYDSPR